MNAQIYNLAVAGASTIWVNPLALLGLITLVLCIVTGLAGRLAILFEDLRYTRSLGRNRLSSPSHGFHGVDAAEGIGIVFRAT